MGNDGVGDRLGQPSLDALSKAYQKKYSEKTRKGYTEINMAMGAPKQGVEPEIKKKPKEEEKKNGPKSKLD